ncbi:hypothetical protein [Flagellimonas sp. CMM7]|uniref:hypothetical protein n=1 Tax=Flagellimonas sp. CMM7 TaxID=2654676 RepID=UPI001969EBBF|nr:hypothetical protein [Flagellimonas sp. CMM7]UII78751.1 hypothetical protein LV704_13900 [Flagellimonas sp. CMM7]
MIVANRFYNEWIINFLIVKSPDRTTMILMHPRDQIINIISRIYSRGMTTTSGGNISILDDDGISGSRPLPSTKVP